MADKVNDMVAHSTSETGRLVLLGMYIHIKVLNLIIGYLFLISFFFNLFFLKFWAECYANTK